MSSFLPADLPSSSNILSTTDNSIFSTKKEIADTNEEQEIEQAQFVEYVLKIPEISPSSKFEKSWLAFNKNHQLIGYFTADSSFVKKSSIENQEWLDGICNYNKDMESKLIRVSTGPSFNLLQFMQNVTNVIAKSQKRQE